MAVPLLYDHNTDHIFNLIINHITCYADELVLQIYDGFNGKLLFIVAMEFWTNFAKDEKNIESSLKLAKFLTGALGECLV